MIRVMLLISRIKVFHRRNKQFSFLDEIVLQQCTDSELNSNSNSTVMTIVLIIIAITVVLLNCGPRRPLTKLVFEIIP